MNNIKTPRPERPDRAMFNAMMGVFFIFFSLPAFYWANYNFGEYSRTTAFVREMREKPETSLSPKEIQDNKNRIAGNSSRADRYKLEMLLSGAGGLMLFGIALLLFRNALRLRNRKNQYENIDWGATPMPTARLEIRYTNYQNILLGSVIGFLGLLTALIFYQALNSRFSSVSEILIKGAFSLFVLALVCFLVYLIIRAKRQAALLLDHSGITRGDGRHFTWGEFQGVLTHTAFNPRTRRKYVWRNELVFANGEAAWIIPNRVKNTKEVFEYIGQLPRASLKDCI